MKIRHFLLLAFALPISACSHGFSHTSLPDTMAAPPVTEEQIKSAYAAKPQLPKPFRVGIAFLNPDREQRFPGGPDPLNWRWTEGDANQIVGAFDRYKSTGQISDVFVISNSVFSGTDLRALRYAAAQHGADALMVVSAEKDTAHSYTGWAWTYIALVPALFVPGSQADVYFGSHAAIWDVRNQYLYLTADAESTQTQVRPGAWIDDEELLNQAKAESVTKLSTQLSKQLESMMSLRAQAR